MKRKILSALLCVAMTATMLAGCGDKADDSKNSDSDTQQEADNNAGDDKQEAADDAGDSEGGGNKLTVWCWDPAFNINAMEKAGEVSGNQWCA